jgi:hypothetical protein
MVTTTGIKQQEIISRLGFVVYNLRLSNSVNLTNDNILLERFFKQVLNVRHGYNLKSVNLAISNYPAIDLEDSDRRICYQISATNRTDKIKTTIKSFKAKRLFEKYDELRFLMLVLEDPCKAEDKDIENSMQTKISTQTVKGLNSEIFALDDETLISDIHDVVTKEIILPAPSVNLPVIEERKYNLPSIQRLIDGLDFAKDYEAKVMLEKDMVALADALADLNQEQRNVIYKYLTLCNYRTDYRGKEMPGEIYMVTEDKNALFTPTEVSVLNTLKRREMLFNHDSFRISHLEWEECDILYFRSECDVNLFGWMKYVVRGNKNKLRDMFCLGDYKHLGI